MCIREAQGPGYKSFTLLFRGSVSKVESILYCQTEFSSLHLSLFIFQNVLHVKVVCIGKFVQNIDQSLLYGTKSFLVFLLHVLKIVRPHFVCLYQRCGYCYNINLIIVLIYITFSIAFISGYLFYHSNKSGCCAIMSSYAI